MALASVSLVTRVVVLLRAFFQEEGSSLCSEPPFHQESEELPLLGGGFSLLSHPPTLWWKWHCSRGAVSCLGQLFCGNAAGSRTCERRCLVKSQRLRRRLRGAAWHKTSDEGIKGRAPAAI